jgi:hypothetical protein
MDHRTADLMRRIAQRLEDHRRLHRLALVEVEAGVSIEDLARALAGKPLEAPDALDRLAVYLGLRTPQEPPQAA